MKILVSNDDGYLAPGLAALVAAMRPLGEVVVVAPDSNRSGSSNSLTLDRPLTVQQAENGFYFVNGTPSDCVHIALTGLLPFKPDLVVSGINQGQNMGDDTLYSGTVAAATEGFLCGISSIAFSQVERNWTYLDSAGRIAREFVQQRLPNLEEPFLLNINIPNLAYEDLQGIMPARLGRRHEAEKVIRTNDPHGREIFWIGPVGGAKDAGEGTDFHVTEKGYVSVTPLQIDLTHRAQLAALQQELA